MTRPWETAIGSRPWEWDAQIYHRVISISRPKSPVAAGNVGYLGDTETNETVIAKNIRANIEMSTSGRVIVSSGIPSDSPGPQKWTITLPPRATLNLPLIMERDVVYDDLGRRFQVAGYQPEALGAKIDTVRLMA